MADREQLLQRQRVSNEFGAFALRCDDLEEGLAQACRLGSEGLGTELAKILQIERERGMPECHARARRGQGPESIEKALSHQLRTRTAYTSGPEGAHITISLPVPGYSWTDDDRG